MQKMKQWKYLVVLEYIAMYIKMADIYCYLERKNDNLYE